MRKRKCQRRIDREKTVLITLLGRMKKRIGEIVLKEWEEVRRRMKKAKQIYHHHSAPDPSPKKKPSIISTD